MSFFNFIPDFHTICSVRFSKIASVGCRTFFTFLPLTISEVRLFSHKTGRRSSALAPSEMALVFLKLSLQDGSNGTPWGTVGSSVEERRPISYPRSGHISLSNLCLNSVTVCLNSVAVYIAAALSPKHALVAECPPGRGQAVVEDLMIKYEDQTSLLAYYMSVMVTKPLIKSWEKPKPNDNRPLIPCRII